MNRKPSIVAIVVLFLWVTGSSVIAQVSALREVVEQATEQIFRSAGGKGLEELTEMGGKTAVRELLEQSSEEGGEQLVKRVTQYGVENGPMALRAIRLAPAKVVASLDGLSPELRAAGLRAIERDPQLMTQIVKEYGSAGLEVSAEHPGVGARLVESLGNDGISIGRKLTTDQAIAVARHADEIANLAPAERAGILRKILKSPGPVLDYLEAHPRILVTAGGVAVVMAIKDDVIGDRGNSYVQPNGTIVTTPPHPGLIERILPRSVRAASPQISIIGFAFAAGLIGWFAVHLHGKWRMQKVRLANACDKQ
jgi:hypothetical protein